MKRQLSIVYLKDLISLPTNGGEINMLNLMYRLKVSGHKVNTICFTNANDNDQLIKLIRRNNGVVIAVNGPSIQYSLYKTSVNVHRSSLFDRTRLLDNAGFRAQILPLLDRQKPEIIFTMLSDFNATEAALDFGSPMISFLMDDEYPRRYQNQEEDDPILTKKRDIIERVPVIATCSDFLSESITKSYGKRAFTLYGQINRGEYLLTSPAKRSHICMINPVLVKGFPLFVAAAAKMPGEQFLAQLNWLIAPEQQSFLDSLTGLFPNLTIRTNSTEMKSFYNLARILLIPSVWQEGYGRVAVEAQINGIPVIGSNIGGLAEAIGAGGILLPPPATRDFQFNEADLKKDRTWFDAITTILAPENYPGYCEKAYASAQAILARIETSYQNFLSFLTDNQTF